MVNDTLLFIIFGGVNLLESFLQSLINFFSALPGELTSFIISALPIVEIKGGLVAAYYLDIDIVPAFIICVLGNLLPVPFIILFSRKILNWMKTTKLFKKLADKIERHGTGKTSSVTKYKALGLFIFVAIPLPGTGAWTGALIAALMNLRLKDALISITAGVLFLGVLFSLLTYGLLASIGL